MKFRPMEEAPISKDVTQQILCRFWYPSLGGHYVYFVALANGVNTRASGYAPPEEWCELPQRKD